MTNIEPKTPAYTLDKLLEAIAQEAEPGKYSRKTGTKYLNLDTRVLKWLIADSRALHALQQDPKQEAA